MREHIQTLRLEIESELQAISSAEHMEEFRLRHLVKKGTLQALVEQLRNVPKEEKPEIGKLLNALRSDVQRLFDEVQERYSSADSVTAIDVTLPARNASVGSLHPITQTMDRLIAIFSSMGFDVA
jgi:phenylalanyl-tRNA synthetase alpha chain